MVLSTYQEVGLCAKSDFGTIDELGGYWNEQKQSGGWAFLAVKHFH